MLLFFDFTNNLISYVWILSQALQMHQKLLVKTNLRSLSDEMKLNDGGLLSLLKRLHFLSFDHQRDQELSTILFMDLTQVVLFQNNYHKLLPSAYLP
jgi:hypothetical protein